MGKVGMGLKKCSTSTDVEGKKKRMKAKKVRASKKMATYDVNIDGQASTIADVHDEIKKLRDSFKEMTETMKNLQENLLTNVDVPEKETSKEKVDPASYEQTIYVEGFDTSLPRDDIKSALVKHFGSCGEITRVFVPFECRYAYIDVKNNHGNPLELLNGSYLGGRKLEVMMAPRKRQDNCFPQCGYCCRKRSIRLMEESLKPLIVKPPPGWTGLFAP